VWGRVRRSFESARAQAKASEDDVGVVRLIVETDVTRFYYTLRSLDAQAQILEQTVVAYREQVRFVSVQLRTGLVSPIVVAQAQAQLQTTLAQQRDILRARAVLEHALAILCGRPAPSFAVAVNPLGEVSPPAVPPGLPAQLLARRPDVAEAEQNLVVANANVGVALASFYPTLQLNAAAGFQSVSVASALDWEQRAWSIGPSLTVPIFEGGRLKANLEQTRARYDELIATYRGAVLGAVRDVEDSLTDLRLRAEAARVQDLAVRSSREYLRLAQLQYRQGLISYLTVIDAERTLLNNELAAAQIRSQRLASTVLLIKAIGGGWQSEP